MRIAIALSMLAMLLSTSEGAFGWAAPGHQTVGAIADDLIAGTPTAKKVRKILGTTLRTASVWADCAKSVTRKPDGSFVYQAEPAAVACRPFENPASEKLLVDFVKRNWDNCRPAPGDEVCHKQYHYAD